MNTERTITIGAIVWLFVQWLTSRRNERYLERTIIDMHLKQDVASAVLAGVEFEVMEIDRDEPENDVNLDSEEIQRANDVLDSWRRE